VRKIEIEIVIELTPWLTRTGAVATDTWRVNVALEAMALDAGPAVTTAVEAAATPPPAGKPKLGRQASPMSL